MVKGLALSSLLATSVFFAAAASAEPLTGQTDATCGSHAAEVLTWRPEHGPPAAFIADAYLQHGGNTFIGLGFDESGYWSAEADGGSDACDDCSSLYLVHTGFDGARRRHLVGRGWDVEQTADTDTERARLKTRLFVLAKGPWRPERLRHDYKLRTPARADDGSILKFTGWFAEASTRGKPTLRFAISSTSNMCWCHDSWSGYLLAPPPSKKAKRNAQ